jgi:hypothetical protein
MNKIVRLTEKELLRLIKNTINEQSMIDNVIKSVKDKFLPDGGSPENSSLAKSKMWERLHLDVEYDNVDIIKETPNQLVIDGTTGKWTITYTK